MQYRCVGCLYYWGKRVVPKYQSQMAFCFVYLPIGELKGQRFSDFKRANAGNIEDPRLIGSEMVQ